MVASGIVVLDRGDDALDLLGQAYDRVLRPSFTTDELPGRDQYLGEAADQTVVLALADGLVVAAGISNHLTSSPIALLGHLAVHPGARGTGVGSKVMARLRDLWPNGSAEVVLGEVHDPRCWPATSDERPEDRLRFYARHGARLASVPWVQPRLRPGGDRVGGMLLLVLGGRGASEDIPAHPLRAWMSEYYAESEGTNGPSSGNVPAWLLRLVDASDPVPVLPLTALAQVPLVRPTTIES